MPSKVETVESFLPLNFRQFPGLCELVPDLRFGFGKTFWQIFGVLKVDVILSLKKELIGMHSMNHSSDLLQQNTSLTTLFGMVWK